MGSNLPGSPMIKTLHFHCRGMGSIPGKGTKIPWAKRHGQKKFFLMAHWHKGYF